MARQSHLPKKNNNPPPPIVRQEVWVPAAHEMNQQRSWPSRGGLFLAAIFTFLLSVGGLVGLVLITLLFFYSDIVFPGTRVATIPVGTLTSGQATAVLAEQIPRKEVLLVHSTGTWPVTVTDLGLALDVQTTVSRATDVGRTFAGLSNLASGNLQVEPEWMFDEERAVGLLDRVAYGVGVQPINAQVIVENGAVRQIPAADGLALDLDMTLNYLRENPTEIVSTGRLPLATRPIAAPVTDTDVFVSEARRFLSKRVAVRAYDPIRNQTAEWDVRPQDWQEWLSLIVTPGDPDPYAWVVDEQKAQQFLSSGWPWLGDQRYLDAGEVIPQIVDVITSGRTGLDARVFYQPIQHTVRPGESFSSIGYNYGIPYPWVQQANPAVSTLSVGDVITVPSPDEMLPLPIVPGKRIVVSLSEQRTRVYENGELLWDWPSSSGISSSPTAPGVFQIQSHEAEAYASNWDLYMPTFMGIYRPVPSTDFMNGFHGFPTRDGFNLLWTGDLGHPVTYGCILLSSENAQTLYGWAEEGVVVEVQR